VALTTFATPDTAFTTPLATFVTDLTTPPITNYPLYFF
jgi:hypothetical protein